MLNREQNDKLKLIVESIEDKLTKEGYIFTARHFDVVMDGMVQVLQQCTCKTLLPLTQKQLNELKTIAEGYTYMTELDETTIATGGIIEIIKQAESYKRQ